MENSLTHRGWHISFDIIVGGLMQSKILFIGIALALFFGVGTRSVFSQTSPSVLYVPLIGLTSVPVPLALPKGPGNVTYKYAVKNFLAEAALEDVKVIDDKCSPVKYVTGDDNNDSKLDYSETWRYTCSTRLLATTQSVATATGKANNILATHNAYASVIVGSNNYPPLVSIINVTKVAYPLSLPANGGKITFTYKVNNPGDAPLSDVTVSDNKCRDISSRLGDINGNNLLDTNEVWIYSCTATLTETTTNTVNVTAYANGLKAVDNATITVKVATPIQNVKIISWEILSGVLGVMIVIFFLRRR